MEKDFLYIERTHSHILPIVRNKDGFLVDADGDFVASDDYRIACANPEHIVRNAVDKRQTMREIIENYNKAKQFLDKAKADNNQEKINHANKVMKNIEQCLMRNQKYIQTHLKLNVLEMVSENTL